jgi:hypothetical protein
MTTSVPTVDADRLVRVVILCLTSNLDVARRGIALRDIRVVNCGTAVRTTHVEWQHTVGRYSQVISIAGMKGHRGRIWLKLQTDAR